MLYAMISGIESRMFFLEERIMLALQLKINCLFVEAILYRYRAGIPWRDLPERFGDFKVIHTRHTR